MESISDIIEFLAQSGVEMATCCETFHPGRSGRSDLGDSAADAESGAGKAARNPRVERNSRSSGSKRPYLWLQKQTAAGL